MKKIVFLILLFFVFNSNLLLSQNFNQLLENNQTDLCKKYNNFINLCYKDAKIIGCLKIKDKLLKLRELYTKEEEIKEFNFFLNICYKLCIDELDKEEAKNLMKGYFENCSNKERLKKFLMKKYNLNKKDNNSINIFNDILK